MSYQHIASVGNKPDESLVHTTTHEDIFDSVDDFEEREFTAHNVNESEVLNIEHHASAQDKNNGGTLNLHNSFVLLDIDAEQAEHVLGEAVSGDKESTHTILNMQSDKNISVEENSLRKEALNHSTNLENPSKVVKMNSQSVALSSSNLLLDSTNGRLSFPITGPTSLD